MDSTGQLHCGRLLLLVFIGAIASCDGANRSTRAAPRLSPDAERDGQAFRQQVLARWDARPAEFYLDMQDLCRETFAGKPLERANAIMRGAGQAFDLARSNQAPALIPAGTTPYGGGLGLHASLISNAGFNITFYAAPTGSSGQPVVQDVDCGIRQVSL